MRLGWPRWSGRAAIDGSGRGHVIAQLDRRIDVLDGLGPLSNTAHNDIAVIENAAQHGLLDVDALDLVERNFKGVPADEALLVDDTPGGHGHLGRPAFP